MTLSMNNQAALWLIVWTLNNIAVTLINKACFAMVHFPYPYALTAIHMAICAAGCHWITFSLVHSPKNNVWSNMLGDQLTQPKLLDSKGQRLVWAFSIIFTLNIAFGNVSLKYVSVNFNQVMRSLVPVITLWCSLLLQKPLSLQRQRAVWPLVTGVALACIGDRLAVTWMGFIYTTLSVLLASIKVVASSELLTGNIQLHPVQLLGHMAPAALMQCIIISMGTGEFNQIRDRWSSDLNPITTGDWKPVLVLFLSGVLAFGLNISALQAYKLLSPLTCCVAAAVKQVLMIVIGTILFQTVVTPLNGIGIFTVLVASAYYSYICVKEKNTSEVKDNQRFNSENYHSGKSCNVGGHTLHETGESDLESVTLIQSDESTNYRN